MKVILQILTAVMYLASPLNAQKISLLAENSKNNRLYVGIDNPLILKNADINLYDSIYLVSNNGKVFFDNTNFICIPKRSGRARLELYGFNSTDTVLLHRANLLVNSFPAVDLQLGDQLISEMEFIPRDKLIGKGGFNIYYNDDIINGDQWFSIHDVTIGYLVKGFYHKHVNNGDVFTGETLNVIEKIRPGSKVSFKVRLKGEGDLLKTLPVYTKRLY